MVVSVEWLLLEWLVPVSTWLHLELNPLPHLVFVALLLALLGSLAIAITVAGSRIRTVVAVNAERPVRSIASFLGLALIPAHRDAPVGGSGPRAPAPQLPALLVTAR